jgi:hypothetical protein
MTEPDQALLGKRQQELNGDGSVSARVIACLKLADITHSLIWVAAVRRRFSANDR